MYIFITCFSHQTICIIVVYISHWFVLYIDPYCIDIFWRGWWCKYQWSNKQGMIHHSSFTCKTHLSNNFFTTRWLSLGFGCVPSVTSVCKVCQNWVFCILAVYQVVSRKAWGSLDFFLTVQHFCGSCDTSVQEIWPFGIEPDLNCWLMWRDDRHSRKVQRTLV